MAEDENNDEQVAKHKVKVIFRVNEHTAALIYLSEIYHIDIVLLVFLYEKYKEDVFYFFYLFSGQQVNHPKGTKLLKILQFSKRLVKEGLRDDLAKSEQERKVLERVRELYVHSKKMFEVEKEVEYASDEVEITAEVGNDSGVAAQQDQLYNSSSSSNGEDDLEDSSLDGGLEDVEGGGI